MKNNKIIIIAPYYGSLYEKTRIHREGVLYSPSLTLAVLGGSIIKYDFQVELLDLNLLKNFSDIDLINLLKQFSPQYAGVTFTTPLFDEMQRITRIIKNFNKDIILIGGGPHASSLPEETLRNSLFDIIVQGEGDFILPRIVSGEDIQGIPNIFYRRNNQIIKNPCVGYIEDLDILPFPAWELFKINKVKTTDLLSRRNPVGSMETSRGCPYGCIYCNKSVHGKTFRPKTPKRVVDEMEHMLRLGFEEIHIIDDGFSTDIERAKEICEIIIRKKMNFPWAPIGGLRVDRAPKELLQLMYQAGCYRVYYGIESGNQQILDNVLKGITLAQVKQAVRDAKDVGLEVFGFFMIGLPGEVERNLKETIRFAKGLSLDMAKATITTPLPGTPLFEKWEKEGHIISRDWSNLNLYSSSRKLFVHPTLDWNMTEKYLIKFHRSFYLDPRFIFKRAIYSLKNKRLFLDIKYFLRTKW